MFNHAEIFQKIEELMSPHTESDKTVVLDLVEQDLARFLHVNRDGIDVDRLAAYYVTAFDRARRPDPRSKQLSLFDAGALIPLGKRRRILMVYATRAHLIVWQRIQNVEFTTSARANVRTNEYIDSRLSVWNSDEYKTLGDLEAAKFSASQPGKGNSATSQNPGRTRL